MWKQILALIVPKPRPEQPAGQSCENCTYFIDYRETEGEDECNGYCSYDFVNLVTSNPYGGHWTHHKKWCEDWEEGEPIFASKED